MDSADYKGLINGHIDALQEAVEMGQPNRAKSEAQIISNICLIWESDDEA